MKPYRHGYTIIEILIVMVIMGIFIGSGVAGYRGFQGRQQTSSFTSQFVADLRLAQSLSFSGEKPAACTDVMTAIKFDVLPGNPQEYKIIAVCGVEIDIKTVVMDKNAEFVPGPKRDVLFFSVTGGTDAPAFPGQDWRIRNLISGVEERVWVTSTGSIRVE